MKQFVAIVIAFFLMGAKDGYTFGKTEFVHEDVQIRVVVHRDQPELEREAERLGALANMDDRVSAFSLIRGKTCEIHILDPRYHYRPELIGHELTHCIYGRWHD